jgi:hypothetical protein
MDCKVDLNNLEDKDLGACNLQEMIDFAEYVMVLVDIVEYLEDIEV